MDDFDFVPGNPSPFTSTAAPDILGKRIVKDEPKKYQLAVKPRRFFVQVAACIVVGVIAMGMLFSVIRLNEDIRNTNKEIYTRTQQLNEAKSENVRLKSLYYSEVSADKIHDFAVNELGMQKVERYQIHYFEDRAGDRVVIAGGRSPGNAD